MRETYIKSETVKRTRNTIKGHFILSDKTRTDFSIGREYGWNQWGNTRANLGLSVERIEKLTAELMES